MLKLISILLTNGIVLFMLISCHNKTGNSKSTVNLEYENSIDSLNSYKMDISHFINSIEPGETIVEEKQMQGEEFITRENENIKVRFFIPEAMLGKFKIGTKVKLICDGCAEPIAGVINYISPEAEFTPPVIYSTKRREKLIFMAEAVPARKQAERMKIGQPFDVEVIGNE